MLDYSLESFPLGLSIFILRVHVATILAAIYMHCKQRTRRVVIAC